MNSIFLKYMSNCDLNPLQIELNLNKIIVFNLIKSIKKSSKF